MKPQCKVFGKAGRRKRTRSRFASLLHPSHGPLHFVASHSRVSLAFRARLYGKYEEPEGGSGQSLDSVKKEKKCFIRYPESYFCGWRDATNGNTPAFIGQYPGTHEFSYESNFFVGHNQRTLNMTATGANKNSAITSCNLTSWIYRRDPMAHSTLPSTICLVRSSGLKWWLLSDHLLWKHPSNRLKTSLTTLGDCLISLGSTAIISCFFRPVNTGIKNLTSDTRLW